MIVRLAPIAVCIAAIAVNIACGVVNPFAAHYEYEEQVYLSVDGRATVVVDASVPALVALRGLALDPSPSATVDRDAVRRVLEQNGCRVDSVSRPWTRNGRRFVQMQVAIDDVRKPVSCGLLAWSSYALTPIDPNGLRYTQTIGPPPAPQTIPGMDSRYPFPVSPWDGSELVAFKLHAPSRIIYQNVKRLDGSTGETERGNILTWEQRVTDRLAGKTVNIDVRMEATSILYTTLWIFGGAFAAAVLVLVLIIWMVMRKGRKLTSRS